MIMFYNYNIVFENYVLNAVQFKVRMVHGFTYLYNIHSFIKNIFMIFVKVMILSYLYIEEILG